MRARLLLSVVLVTPRPLCSLCMHKKGRLEARALLARFLYDGDFYGARGKIFRGTRLAESRRDKRRIGAPAKERQQH